MTKMDHKDAIKMEACTKYLLGELSVSQRDEFEQHYFDCQECAEELRANSVFLAASRDALEKSLVPSRQSETTKQARGWFLWLRPAFAVPAFALLLIVLSYQNLVTIPQFKHLASQATSSNLLNPILLHPGVSRGTEPSIPVTPGQSFAVYLDIPTEPSYSSYRVRLQDASGSSRDLLTLSSADIQKSPLLKMPSDLASGTAYTIHVLGSSQPGSGATEVASFSFRIEIPGNIGQH